MMEAADYPNEYKEIIGNVLDNLRVLYGVGFKGKDIIYHIQPTNLIEKPGSRQSLPWICVLL